MAARWWVNSLADNDGNAAGNWSAGEGGAGGAGVPGVGDNAYYSATSSNADCVFTVGLTCDKFATIAAETGGTDDYAGTVNGITDGGLTFSIAGTIAISNLANALTSTGLWIQTANGNFYNPNLTNIIKQLTANAITTLTVSSYVHKLNIGAAGDVTGAFFIRISFDANDALTIAAGGRLTTAGMTLSAAGADRTLHAVGCVLCTATIYFAFTGRKLTLTGNFSFPNADFGYFQGEIDCDTFDLTINDVKMGYLGGVTGTLRCGSGTIDFNNLDDYDNTSLGVIIGETSQITCGGNLDLTNITWTRTSETLTFDGAGAQLLTSSGQALPNVVVNKGNTLTLADALACLTYNHIAGTVDRNGNNITTATNYTVGVAAVITAAGLIGSITTVGGIYAVTGTALNIHNLNPAGAWTLNVTGASAVIYANVRNSDASGGAIITADDNTCTDQGGNLNWDFFLSGIEVMANMSLSLGLALT